MAITRVLYSSHITELILPAVGELNKGNYFPARRISLPSTGANCDETIPLEDVTVLGNLGSAGRIQKDVVGCKSSIKFYLAEAYQKDSKGRTGGLYNETNASNQAGGSGIQWTAKPRSGSHYAQNMHSLTGRDCEHMRQAALAGANIRASLYQPAGNDPNLIGETSAWRVDDDERDSSLNGTCSDTNYTTQAACEGIGTCSDSSYDDNSTGCLANGDCSNASFNNNQAGCCSDGGGNWDATAGTCDSFGSNTWTANTWTANAGTWQVGNDLGEDAGDVWIDERTDFVMYGIMTSLNLNVSKGGFIEGDLALEGVGRPYLMGDYNDQYDGSPDDDTGDSDGDSNQNPVVATHPDLKVTNGKSNIMNYRNLLEPFSQVSCTPILPTMDHLIVGARTPVTVGWEDENRFTSMMNGGDAPGNVMNQYEDQTSIYIYQSYGATPNCSGGTPAGATNEADCDTNGGTWIDYGFCNACDTTPCTNFITKGTCEDDNGTWVASATGGMPSKMSNSWVPSSVKFSFDMPTEQLTTFGSQNGKANLDSNQYKFDGAANVMGDLTTANIGENTDFKKSFQVFSKPPFKSSLTIEGVNLSVFPSNFATLAQNYINTIYMGHLIIRMPHNGNKTTNNTSTAVTTRSMNQAVGDIGANYSVTLEANDVFFSDRVTNWGGGSSVGCSDGIQTTEALCCTENSGTWAAGACTGGSETWDANNAGGGSTRQEFDPFKIFTTSGAGA